MIAARCRPVSRSCWRRNRGASIQESWPADFYGKDFAQWCDVNNSSAFIAFPYDLKETYGVGNLVPFKATFDGQVTYRGSLSKMGGPTAMLLLRKDVRAELGKEPGESVEVVVELDDKPRELAIAKDTRRALQTAGLWEKFESLAYTHRKEYVVWIEDAKKPETRAARIQKMCEMLKAGKKSNR